MYERRHQKLAPKPVFLRRMATHAGIVLVLIAGALSIGIAGYHSLAGLGWIDSLLNASMILSGMGQIDILTNPEAKIFASVYALFSGLIMVATVGLLFVPILHRAFHKFHLEE